MTYEIPRYKFNFIEIPIEMRTKHKDGNWCQFKDINKYYIPLSDYDKLKRETVSRERIRKAIEELDYQFELFKSGAISSHVFNLKYKNFKDALLNDSKESASNKVTKEV